MNTDYTKLSSVPTTDTLETGDKFLIADNDSVKFYEVTTTNCGGGGYFTINPMTYKVDRTTMPKVTTSKSFNMNIFDKLNKLKDVIPLKGTRSITEMTASDELFKDLIDNKKIYVWMSLAVYGYDESFIAPLTAYMKIDNGADNLYVCFDTHDLMCGMAKCPKEYFDKLRGEIVYDFEWNK